MTLSDSPHPRLIGALQIPSNSTLWVRRDGGAWAAVDISSEASSRGRSSYYVLGDGTTEDLLDFLADEINTALVAAGGSGTWAFTLSTDGTYGQGGIVRYTQTEGVDVDLSFVDPASSSSATSTWVRDWLRMATGSPDSISTTSGVTYDGFRSHAFSVYPTYLAFEDLDETVIRGSQAVPDEGTPFSLKLAARTLHHLGIRLGQALPRSTTWNEYDQLQDFLDFASRGWVFRHYPRDTVTAAYVQNTTPYGYREYVLDRESWSWRPEPAYGNWYKQFKIKLKMHEATSL